ncbi:MAG: M28 family peptidase, partial [Planctomycetota bacterium]
VDGASEPVRVTYTMGFDGLPVFTPDGNQLAWTSNRTAAKKSQIFLASWNHGRARDLLGLQSADPVAESTFVATVAEVSDAPSTAAAMATHELASPEFEPEDVRRHVEYLCSEELAGRFTGTRGEKLATEYVAAYMDLLGLEPAGDDGSWYQPFDFTSGVALGDDNRLSWGDVSYEVDKDWRPLAFSGAGPFEPAPLVLAGYGLVAKATEDQEMYDSYVHLDVKDKWVVVFRYLPEDVSAERRQHLNRASQLRFKATFARERGAHGLIVVTGPNAQAKTELAPLRMDGILAGSSLPVISVTDEVADAWLAGSGKSVKQLQDELDGGSMKMGFAIDGVELAAEIEVERITSAGRNVLGRLNANDDPSDQAIVIGAHVDHLGKGASSSSLARDEEAEKIHYGADDNASGVAAMLEIAEYLADQREQGRLELRRDLIFAAWSGEELGLLGSDHYVKSLADASESADNPVAHAHGGDEAGSIYPAIAACLNMDMVGRLDKNLILQGIGSSSVWRSEVERRNAPVGLPITLQEDSYLPTDAASFYMRGVPILSAFTGAHSDYHTPRDTPDLLNYEGAAQVARFMGLVARSLALSESPPDYIKQSVKQETSGGRLRAYLGTIPDYAEEVQGVLLSGASKNGPADKAGIRSRDVIVELAGKKIENIYDYTNAIEGLKIGDPVTIVVQRGEELVSLEIIPGSRE